MILQALKQLPFYGCLPCMLVACMPPSFSGSANDVVLAKVYDEELLLEDAQKAIGNKYKTEDSVAVFYEYVQKWIRTQTLIQKAKESLSEEEKDKSNLIIQYYNDLLVYELNSKLIQERLDTAVSPHEIETYYEKNLQNFELKENIVRLNFVKFGSSVPDQERLWNLFLMGNEADLNGMQHLATLSGGNFFRGDSIWLSFADILKEVPIVTYNQENYLNNNKYIRLVDKGYIYFVRILEFKVKNNVSPLEFERQRIKNILVNKRKVELMQQIEKEIVEEAYKNKKIQTF